VADLVDRFSKSSQFIITTFRPELLLQAYNMPHTSLVSASMTVKYIRLLKYPFFQKLIHICFFQSTRAFPVIKKKALEFVIGKITFQAAGYLQFRVDPRKCVHLNNTTLDSL